MTVSPKDIDRLLPQTQCERCGYAGCKPYAEAVAAGEADINRCPPGGEATIHGLAELTGTDAKPLDPECGRHTPPQVALIDEKTCIGCTRCIQACPVDAIVGAAKSMHTVIANECTGCELCLAPCPVDCIDLVNASPGAPAEPEARTRDSIEALRRRHIPANERHAADRARRRVDARNERLEAVRRSREHRRRATRAARARAARRDEIAGMVAAVHARRQR